MRAGWAVCVALVVTGCARANLRPQWVRTAAMEYGCPAERVARADTGRNFIPRDPRTFIVGASVCDVIVLAGIPNRIEPDTSSPGEVREVWVYYLAADQAGGHIGLLLFRGQTRRELLLQHRQDVVVPLPRPRRQWP